MKRLIYFIFGWILFSLFASCSDNQELIPVETSGFKQKNFKIPLHFNKNKTFRILQLTDLHIDQSQYEQVIKQNIIKLIGYSDPDLIVFTGDIVTGQPASLHWITFGAFMSTLDRPYLITLGNHDSQYFLTRKKLYEMIRNFPNCQNVFYEDSESFTQGDMVVEIENSTKTGKGALLYLFDTNDFSNTDSVLGIRPQQTAWLKTQGITTVETENSNIPALVFMHVPLREFKENATKENNELYGLRGETEYYSSWSNGFFEALKEKKNVCGVFCGHDHFNNYLLRVDDIALCYGRKSGSRNTYQLYPTGARVIEIHENKLEFQTHILESDGNRVYPYLFIK
ncbi:MAG: metallophosphoesterase [Bacteroidales bacterium]